MKRSFAAIALLACSFPLFAAVSGTVMTSDGQAIAGARVSIFAIESAEARRTRLLSPNPEPVPVSSTQTDAKGSFSLESPKDAVTELRVQVKGYEPLMKRIERDEDNGAIVLSKAEYKRGSVKANGKAVASATVALSYSGSEYTTKTDAEGRYDAPDPKRARAIAVIHPDFAVSDEIATGFRDGISTLDRTLAAGSPLTGKVVKDDGKTPLAKATIFVDGWPLGTSGEDGTFTVARAPAKWTTVVAQTSTLIGSRQQTSERPLTIRAAKAATIAGRVLDAKTKVPVAGAVLRVGGGRGMGMRGGGESGSWWGGVSDAKGNFSFNLAPGTYMLIASHPAFDTRPLDVNVAAGQTSSKELVLTPLARVGGVVLNEERKPVAAATVATQDVRDSFEMMIVRGPGGAASNGYSGPDGRFSFRIRSDSDLKLRATKKGYPPATSDTLRLAPGERRSNFVLTIPSGVEVTGKVTDRDGNPLSGVAVAAQPTPTGQRGMVQRIIMNGLPQGNDDDSVRSASDGTFAIRVTEGTYDFAFRREGFSTKSVRAKSISIGGINSVETALDPSVEISGRVVRAGTGVEGVNVSSFGFDGGDSADAMTGPDGSFTLRGLSPGSARLMLRKEEQMVNEQRTVTAPARDVTIELPVGVSVSGRVVDKSTHKPLTAFQVGVSPSRSGGGMVMMMPPMLRSFTSDDGSFTIENVPVGAVNFVASAPGYSTSRLNLNTEEAKPVTDLEIELDTGVKLVGKITGPDGAALGDATVQISMMAGPGMNVSRATDKRTTTSSSGEYELEALEAGEETIQISHPKYLSERKTVQLKGREVRLDVQLSAGTKISGSVVTESGAPVAEADVEAMAAGGSMRRGKTDASGRFELDSLSPARYQFSASKAGYAEGVMRDVDVSAGAPVRIVLKSGGTIYGVVRGLPEQELATTTVEARGPEGTAVASVDASGAYKLEGVPAGTVSVRATSSGRSFTTRKTSTPQTLQMEAGASRQLDLEFRTDTVVKGSVRRNGQPLSGAGVTFLPKPGSTQQTSATVTTDEQGNYAASGLDNGEYSVMVTDIQRFTSYTTTYEVRGSATFDIDHTANALRGRVVEATSGEPINEARVQLRGTGANAGSMRFSDRMTATDKNGTFNLDLVATGNYTITADKQGYGNQVLDLVVTDRPAEKVELRLQRNEGIALKVVDSRDGHALSAMLVVFDLQGRIVHEQRFFFPGEGTSDVTLPLAAGNYMATVGAMGYGTRQVSLRSPSNQTVSLAPAGRINVRSKHSERMRARLVDSNGMIYPRWNATPTNGVLNPNPGATIIDSVAGGTYTLQLIDENGAVIDSKQVVVADGQTVEVEI
jgi:hypothetical protein